MKGIDILRIAFMNLWRRKLRAFLTVLGMVIGTTSIVVMVSLGIGMQSATQAMFESWGSLTTIDVSSWNYNQETGMSSEMVLDERAVQTFRQIEGVRAVMPQVQTYGMLTSGQYVSDVQILGVDPEVAADFGFDLTEGSSYPANVGGSRVELTFGSYVFESFYNPRTGNQAFDMMTGESKITMDSRIELTFDYNNVYDDGNMYYEEGMEVPEKGKIYRVDPVGIQTGEGNNNSYYTLMNMETLEKLARDNKDFMYFEAGEYDTVLVRVEDSDDVLAVQEQIEDMGYGVFSLQDALEMEQQSARQTQSLLGAIGGVALLVAAIGIMNTMMMSIYERTKEIGIIKVLGCKMGNISSMFLAEAAYIGFFGGALGLGLSYGLSYVLNTFVFMSGDMGGMGGMGTMHSVIPIWLALLGVVFSIIVALLSGMYPAIKAMRLSALAAIRSE